MFQAILVGNKHLTGFTTLERSHDACRFQLVDDSSCPVVADGETSLDGESEKAKRTGLCQPVLFYVRT